MSSMSVCEYCGRQSSAQDIRCHGCGAVLHVGPPPTEPAQRSTPKRLKALGKFFAVVTCLILAAGVIGYFQVWIPNQKLRDLKWFESADKTEKRCVAHQVLQFPWGNDHDAFLILAETGNPSSIPILIAALRWQEHTDNSGAMECTKGHCLQALQRLTRSNAGPNYEDWKRWWKQHKNDEFLELDEQLWNVRWEADTRERFVSLTRQQHAERGLDLRAGESWVANFERELQWHPIPNDVAQTDKRRSMDRSGVRLLYRLHASNQVFEFYDFTEVPVKAAAVEDTVP
jgi:hypothetical protein